MSIRAATAAVLAGLLLPSLPARGDTPAEEQLARLIKTAVLARAPKDYEDHSGWGRTTPVIEGMRLPNLRQRVRVGDHDEWPDGQWVRTRVRVDDPDRDVTIRVRNLRPSDHKSTLLTVDATVKLRVEHERQLWRRGLMLVGVTARADAVIDVSLDIDATVGLDTTKVPPEVSVKPTVTAVRLDLSEFELLDPERALNPDRARAINNDIRAFLQEGLKQAEPAATERFNDAVRQALKTNPPLAPPKER